MKFDPITELDEILKSAAAAESKPKPENRGESGPNSKAFNGRPLSPLVVGQIHEFSTGLGNSI